MTNEEAKEFLDNLKICISEHPIVADWLVEIADRKTEPTISKMKQVPNCIDCTHYGDYEVCKGCDDDYNKFKSYYEPKDEPQTCSVNGRPYSECGSCEHFKCTADEPQTEREGE